MIAFLLHPISICMYAVTAGSVLILSGLGSWDDGRRARGACTVVVAAALILGGYLVGISSFEPPHCPPSQHLHGAAGRILWCAS